MTVRRVALGARVAAIGLMVLMGIAAGGFVGAAVLSPHAPSSLGARSPYADSLAAPSHAFIRPDITPLEPGDPTPGASTIDVGQTEVLTAHPSGGLAPYTIRWLGGSSSSCSSDSNIGVGGSTANVSPSSSEYFCYNVTDSSTPTHQSGESSTVRVTVNSALLAAPVSPSGASIDLGQSITLTAGSSGGTPPYSYQWYGGSSSTCASDTAISGAVGSTYLASPSSDEFYCFTVTDGAAGTPTANVSSTTALVTVNSALTIGAITPGSLTIDVGQSVNLTANPSGGTPPYGFDWFVGSSSLCLGNSLVLGADLNWYLASPTSSTYVCYLVQDSSSVPAGGNSTTVEITVNSALVAGSISPTTPTIDNGGSITLTAAPSGGTGPYQYQWYEGLSTTCSSDTEVTGATDATFVADPSSGTYYCYIVTDSSAGLPGAIATSGTDFVQVNSALIAGAITSPTLTISSGQSLTLTANPTGGTPGYSYQWYAGSSASCASDTAVTGANSPTLDVSPTSSTYYCYVVTDTSTGSTGTSSATVYVVVQQPSSSPSFPWLYVILGVVAAIVVVGALAVYLRMRKSAPKEPDQKPPA